MAVRGTKPKATVIKLVTGNPGHRPLPTNEPMPAGRPSPPIKLTGRPLALWRRFVVRAWWLSDADSPKAWLWVQLQAEAEAGVATMTAARIGQLRSLGSELGFDPASRARMGTPPPNRDAAESYFTE